MASRLEALNSRYGTEILAAEPVVSAAGDGFLWREIDRVIVKGKESAIGISEPLCTIENATDALRELKRRYEEAFAEYAAGRFAEAESILVALLKTAPGDGPSESLLERCLRFQKEPPEGEWDGVTRFATK